MARTLSTAAPTIGASITTEVAGNDSILGGGGHERDGDFLHDLFP